MAVTSPDIDLFDREAVLLLTITAIPCAVIFEPKKSFFEHITTQEAAHWRARRRRVHGSDHHRASFAVQPQRDFHRRDSSALLLPARTQAREAPGLGAGRGGIKRQFFLAIQRPHPGWAHLKSTPQAAPVATPRTLRWSCMPRPLLQAHLHRLEGFASFNGADFTVCRAIRAITLRKESWTPPESFALG
jgi:dihydroorotase